MSLFFHHPPAITKIPSFTPISTGHGIPAFRRFIIILQKDLKVSLAVGLDFGFKLKAAMLTVMY